MFTAIGGLISYGIDSAAVARHAGVYAGRILKGTRVGRWSRYGRGPPPAREEGYVPNFGRR